MLKLGEKDKDGRQKRIEHTGRYLRVSRTGGVSLRAQTRVAGANVTANTSHGLRLSTRLARNTQVALQNGRFVLRGRYGSDAAKLNLSKSGLTVSSRTPTGTFNWVKPGRSSFKAGGVQVRGQTAAWLQLFTLGATLVLAIFRGLYRLGSLLGSGLLAVGYGLKRRRVLAADEALRAELEQAEGTGHAARVLQAGEIDLKAEPPRDLLAGLAYCLVCLGRGEVVFKADAQYLNAEAGAAHRALETDMTAAGQLLSNWLPAITDAAFPATALGLTQAFAEALREHLNPPIRTEALLALDDVCLAMGPRSVLQEVMMDRVADCWQVALQLEGEA